MDSGSPPNLDGLAHLSQRSGVDMRPTLLRVLTDLYVQKLTHTADEERHYTELALRLLDTVDVATRTAVATRLARHLAPPRRILERLAGDLPAIAEPVRAHPLLRAGAKVETPKTPSLKTPTPKAPIPEPASSKVPAAAPAAVATAAAKVGTRLEEDSGQDETARPPVDLSAPIEGAVASELNELFFAANAEERRLILLNLEIAAPLPAGHVSLARDPAVAQRLERAALAQNREDFAEQLATALQIPPLQARRIAGDELGEAIITAAKALGMPRDVLYRILLFVNTAVGHSVERVHALANLFDEITMQAAQHMVAIWQALQKPEPKAERKPARYQPLLWNDETRVRARPAGATTRRAPAASRPKDRRDVS
jgi:uncharacterized protein (DUF2336 family)